MKLTLSQRLFLAAMWFIAYPVRWLGWVMIGGGLAVILNLMIQDFGSYQRAFLGLIFFQNPALIPPFTILFLGLFFTWISGICRETFRL